jgi:MFS family permease
MSKQWRFLYLSNFSGVFNDNLLKNAIIFMAASWTLPSWLSHSQLIALVSASLILPYLVLSPLAGRWAVQFSKQTVFKIFKLIEIPIMMLATAAFIFEQVFVAITAVLLMGIQSCLYSPAKYGLIRDIGGIEGSAKGSGVFEAMAFLGILAGTVTAAWLSDLDKTNLYLIILFFVLAFIGIYAVFRLKVTELAVDFETSQKVRLNPFRFIISSFRIASAYPSVNKAVFGVSFFWMIGGMLQMNIVLYASNVLNVSNTTTGFFMAMAAVGIIAGNWLAGVTQHRFSKRLFVLAGSAGMTIGFAILTLIKLPVAAFAAVVMLIAFSGGFFQVPWLTIIQQADAGRRAGQLLAYMNISVFVFVLLGTFVFSLVNLLTSDNSVLVFFVLLLLNAVLFVLMLFKK